MPPLQYKKIVISVLSLALIVACNNREKAKVTDDYCKGLQMIIDDYPNNFMNITHSGKDETKAARDGNIQFPDFYQSGLKFAESGPGIWYHNYRFAAKTIEDARYIQMNLLTKFRDCHIHWNNQDVTPAYFKDTTFSQPTDGYSKPIHEQYVFYYKEHQLLPATNPYRYFNIRVRVRDDHYGTFAVEMLAGLDSTVIQ